MIKYSRLEKILQERNIKKSAMGRDLGISSRTIAKIGRGERLSVRILDKLAHYLACSPKELYEVVADNPLLQRLREEKQMARLLAAYQAKPEISLQDIMSFHAAFEKIHPFQDGNGRVAG